MVLSDLVVVFFVLWLVVVEMVSVVFIYIIMMRILSVFMIRLGLICCLVCWVS